MKKTQKEKEEVSHYLYRKCLIVKYDGLGDKNQAYTDIISHDLIRKKIDYEANRLCMANRELYKSELVSDIKTILYMAIYKEFTFKNDPNKMLIWIVNRITWRSLDYIRKEFDLVWEKKDNKVGGNYSRINKVGIDEEYEGFIADEKSVYLDFGYFLKKAKINIQHKHLFFYLIFMNFTLNELAEIYGLSRQAIVNRLRKARTETKQYIENLDQDDQETILEILNR